MISVTKAAVAKLAELGNNIIEYDLDIEGWNQAFGPLVLHNEYRERAHLLDEAADILTGYERRSLEIARELSAEDAEYRRRIQALFDDFDLIITPTTAPATCTPFISMSTWHGQMDLNVRYCMGFVRWA